MSVSVERFGQGQDLVLLHGWGMNGAVWHGIAQQLAERSVAENQDVISETLAKLYAKQGYRDKSAQMYARLALLFPEKSAYFAAEIDKLKK